VAMPYWFPAAELFVSFLPVLSRPEGGKNALELYLNFVDRPEHENAAYLPAVM
jgi:hypothetical protein